MTTVETAGGPAQADLLATTPMHEHEHVFVMTPEWLGNWSHAYGPSPWDEDERVADRRSEWSTRLILRA